MCTHVVCDIITLYCYGGENVMNLEQTTKLIDELRNTRNIDTYLNRYDFDSNAMSFVDYLNYKISESGKKKAHIIRAINLSRSYAYEVFSGYKNPSRDKVIMLSFGMDLNFDETQKLLIMAKYNPLYPKDKRDSIIMYAKYNSHTFMEVNMLLLDFEEEPLT